MAASLRGNKDTVEVLLKELRADVHAADNDGHTTVWDAAQGGHKDTVEVLVKEFGATLPQEQDEEQE